MFSARTPYARSTVYLAIIFVALLAAPSFAQQRPVATAGVSSTPAPPSANPLEMTRDGNAGGAGATDARGQADAGRLNPVGQIVRMVGALGIVLLLLLGGAHVVRRSPLAATPGTVATPQDLSFAGTLKAAFSFSSPLAAISSLKRAGSQPRAMSPTPPDPGPMRLSGTQTLPGSDSCIHLVQIGAKSLLLGTSSAGPIQVLGEFGDLAVPSEKSISATQREQDEDEAFEALLREEMPLVPKREEARVVQSIVDRLNRTQERLSRHLQDDDGTIPGQGRFSA